MTEYFISYAYKEEEKNHLKNTFTEYKTIKTKQDVFNLEHKIAKDLDIKEEDVVVISFQKIKI